MEKHKSAMDLLFSEVTKEAAKCTGDKLRTLNVDVYHDEQRYIIYAEMPGVDCSDIDIDYDGGYLKISGRKVLRVGEGMLPLRTERCYGEYKRSFAVDGIDPSSIKAEYVDGVLVLEMKKMEGARK